ncbi:CerR family C-terminal domain-containing protein [Zoogloea sp.]|uniref:CerR family C-terminal domain-containing protein n=1 Tax=Zoogloea sp. TaxID=49181 RepID=UPI0025D05B1B|nr:CerR family C-terminal domain-containing protein [Zoogloea sp.]MCK6393203.1 CerR family C-terminal domain-containing protein [Zoogloea sp.]
MSVPPPPSHTPTRSDGTLARQRLLEAALQLFADKGYQKTSTREIADAAGVNLGSISYYFGDKPGLYRAVFCESFCDATATPDILQARDCLPDPTAALDPDAALAGFFFNFLHPLKQGALIRLVMRLHFRELVEPSGVMGTEMDDDLADLFRNMSQLISRHLGLASPDTDTLRLTHAVLGMAMHFFVAQDLVDQVSPELVAKPESIDALAERLAAWAAGMIDAEARRRHTSGGPA